MRNQLTLVTYRDKKKQFRFHFKRNGKILMQGEGYKRRAAMNRMLNNFFYSIETSDLKEIDKEVL